MNGLSVGDGGLQRSLKTLGNSATTIAARETVKGPDGALRRAPAPLLALIPAAAVRDASTLKTVKAWDIRNRFVWQGELRVGRDANGKNVFWLEGLQGRPYPLVGPTGRPVTNTVDAEARAKQLMHSGAATQLRKTTELLDPVPTAANVFTVDKPGSARTPPKVLAINLENPAISSRGGQGRARTKGSFLAWDLNLPGMNNPHLRHNLGSTGSALTSSEAVARLQSQGVAVEVSNLSPNGPANLATWIAVARLNNDFKGGYQYGNATAPRGTGELQSDAPPTYSLPKNASPEFERGFSKARREHGLAQFAQASENIAQGSSGGSAARGGGSGGGLPINRGQPIKVVRPSKAAARFNPGFNPGTALTPNPVPTSPRRLPVATNTIRTTTVLSRTRAQVQPNPSVKVQLDLRWLSPDRFTAKSARDFLADVASMGPNPVLPDVAAWLQKAHPSFMQANGGVLGREVKALIAGGKRGQVPQSLAAHAESRKWTRYNAGDLATSPTAALSNAVSQHFSEAHPLRRVLDLGSGNGIASRYVLAQDAQTSVTAVDGDRAALTRLKASVPPGARSRLTTVRGDVTRVDYGKAQDLVVAERLFPHLNDTQVSSVMSKASAALKPGGIMVCDFLTTDHGSAKSRGANYRTEAQALGLVPASFQILSSQSSGGIMRLTLQRLQ